VSLLRLFGAPIILAVWAGLSFAGVHGDFTRGVFLTLVAVAVVVAERERKRRYSGRQ
jgi:hypothetical protein